MDWSKIANNSHTWDEFLLVACKGLRVDWTYCVAVFNSQRQRWENEFGCDLIDYGYTPLYWSVLPNKPE